MLLVIASETQISARIQDFGHFLGKVIFPIGIEDRLIICNIAILGSYTVVVDGIGGGEQPRKRRVTRSR